MEGKPAEEIGFTVRNTLFYSVIAIALLTILLSPGLVSNNYLRALNTVCLVAILGLVGRTLIGAVYSFKKNNPPELQEELPTVSVLLPAYNEEKVLEDTLEACTELDYPEDKYEILVCYEAECSDRTGKIAQQYAEEYEVIRALKRDEEGGGKARATNYALEHADNEIIGLIDADHRYRPDALKKAVRWFRREDVWCVKGRCYGRNPESSLMTLHATLERHIAERIDIYARHVMNGFGFFGGGQAFFRRDVFEELGTFSERTLVEDIDMSAEIQRAGKQIAVDMDVVTFEENPADLNAWWQQRMRWTRGWMQVALRHTIGFSREKKLPLKKRIDGAFTLGYAIVPSFLVVLLPLTYLNLFTSVETQVFLPYSQVLWGIAAVAPFTLSMLVFFHDRKEYRHLPRELLASITLWGYFFCQALVHITSFIDEFILDKKNVFVTTTRVGD